MNAAINAVNSPFVPKNPFANPPPSTVSAARSKKPDMEANIVERKLILFVFSSFLLKESVKDFAVVPATKTPKIPIVYPYGFIIKASVDALHEKPKILGTYAINKRKYLKTEQQASLR